jgi:hypothetical protein
MTSTTSSTKSQYSNQMHNPQSQFLNPSPRQSVQNIKYFLENFKYSQASSIFSDKFTNSGLYTENSQVPDSFYKLHKPFDRNAAFFIPHGNRRNNGNYYKNKNWYPKYPMILSKNCELIRKNKGEAIEYEDNDTKEGAKDFLMQNNFNRFYSIKYCLDDKNVESGPFSAGVVFTFLKNYYINKPEEEQKKMNLLIRDIFDDSCFPPETLFNSLQKGINSN